MGNWHGDASIATPGADAFKAAAQVFGHLISAQEMYLERYRVEEFSSEEHIALLAAAD